MGTMWDHEHYTILFWWLIADQPVPLRDRPGTDEPVLRGLDEGAITGADGREALKRRKGRLGIEQLMATR
jgi:hypothetical protein